MSQTVKFTRIEDTLYPDVLRGFPDKDEAISMIREMLETNLLHRNTGWYEVVTGWYEVGDGESGMHTFFSDEQLLEWEENGEFVKKVEEAGYNAEHIETRTIEVIAEEIDGDFEEDEDFDYDDDADEIGFNPYMGCYDFDC